MIVGFILSKLFGRSRPAGDTGDLGLLEERLGQANEGLGKFSLQLEAQNAEIKQQQLQLQEAKEAAAISRTQLDAITKERDELKSSVAVTEEALERDPDLLEYAFSKNIILTFPTSLLAILKGLAMSIQQAEIATNIEEIQNNAVELHKRFLTFVDKFNAVGSNLSRLNKSYNEAVGSAQSRLIPQGRRFSELAGQGGEAKLNDAIDSVVREIQGGE